jgi:hypothetical protein
MTDEWDYACHLCGQVRCGCTPEDVARERAAICPSCGRYKSASMGCPDKCVDPKKEARRSLEGPIAFARLVHGAPNCGHCGDPVDVKTQTHWYEGPRHDGYGHKGLCCDCMDLSCGQALNGRFSINEERIAKGKAPITKPWPGLDEHGNQIEPYDGWGNKPEE